MTQETTTAAQGEQPTFAGVRVGVMRVGVRGDRARVQLAVRSPHRQDVVVVDRGGSVDLHGAGTLHVDAVDGVEGSSRGTVTFTFEPA
ncbi:hypothetical protein [Cellulosimicrobium marinum]|uniref:hypothetical protein n=1 Tax=Cellulosimicrobium marinum TaxID=1638992 RepID=UPI001E46936C|nr:hypothetical protein [Cellulosimicrobium marinum]MCB7136077.1 hypothetical protein [Cellulosimicrobium marinum]